MTMILLEIVFLEEVKTGISLKKVIAKIPTLKGRCRSRMGVIEGVERFDLKRQVLWMAERVFADDKLNLMKITQSIKKNMSFLMFSLAN